MSLQVYLGSLLFLLSLLLPSAVEIRKFSLEGNRLNCVCPKRTLLKPTWTHWQIAHLKLCLFLIPCCWPLRPERIPCVCQWRVAKDEKKIWKMEIYPSFFFVKLKTDCKEHFSLSRSLFTFEASKLTKQTHPRKKRPEETNIQKSNLCVP